MVPQTTPRAEATALECAWGIPPHGLNLDTSQNLVSVRADYGHAFDNHNWVMVPSHHDLLWAMVAACSGRYYLEVFPPEEYEYTLVHLKGHPLRINREQVPLVLPYQAELHPYETYYAPYHNFPLLRSQVHPYFAIIKAGKAMEALTEEERTASEVSVPNLEDVSSVGSCLALCRIILGLWMPNSPTRSAALISRSMSSEIGTTIDSRSSRSDACSSSRRSGTSGKPSPGRYESQYRSPIILLGSLIQDLLVASEESAPGHDVVDIPALENHDGTPQLDIAKWIKDVSACPVDELEIPESDTAEYSMMHDEGEAVESTRDLVM
ncbi:hypothetical protein RSOLAG22IIIB_10676 [Rhizoctonia solani]|uniref:HNH nuclease domain-containing protein n=1 Tax=Rhizoctonia solani TaxID=456999 RepID=A0A0K6G408_9AGAM|nr:hypothetical protein RSOLAG22IIIB_10676 [Rhizoctonia solani]